MSTAPDARRPLRAVFLGSKGLGRTILEALLQGPENVGWTIVHPDDRTDGRSVLPAFRQFARERGLPFELAASPAQAKSLLRNLAPDIVFVCGWYWLLDAQTLASVPQGVWGIHNSLLPKYRGGSPLVWSIINSDVTVGSTVFRIGEGMDDGDVLGQIMVPLREDHDIADVLTEIERGLLARLPGWWAALIEGRAVLTPQDETAATYCGQRVEEDGHIDWTRGARAVHDFVRAQAPPYPGAFGELDGTRLRILKTRIFDGVYFGTPGQILRRLQDSVLVSCGGGGAIELLRVDTGTPGELAVSPSQLIRSVRGRFR